MESRQEAMARLSDTPDYKLPEMGPLSHIITWFIELGEVATTADGLSPLSWQEIKAWSELTGLTISPREGLALRRLSVAYVREYYRSNNHNCASPILDEPDRHKRVERQLKEAFKVMRR